MITSSTLKPLFAIALLASPFECKILLSTIKSKIFIPFSILSNLIFISGKSKPKPPFSNVSLAVSLLFLKQFHHEEF